MVATGQASGAGIVAADGCSAEPVALPGRVGADMQGRMTTGEQGAVLVVAAADQPYHGNVSTQAVIEHRAVSAASPASVSESRPRASSRWTSTPAS